MNPGLIKVYEIVDNFSDDDLVIITDDKNIPRSRNKRLDSIKRYIDDLYILTNGNIFNELNKIEINKDKAEYIKKLKDVNKKGRSQLPKLRDEKKILEKKNEKVSIFKKDLEKYRKVIDEKDMEIKILKLKKIQQAKMPSGGTTILNIDSKISSKQNLIDKLKDNVKINIDFLNEALSDKERTEKNIKSMEAIIRIEQYKNESGEIWETNKNKIKPMTKGGTHKGLKKTLIIGSATVFGIAGSIFIGAALANLQSCNKENTQMKTSIQGENTLPEDKNEIVIEEKKENVSQEVLVTQTGIDFLALKFKLESEDPTLEYDDDELLCFVEYLNNDIELGDTKIQKAKAAEEDILKYISEGENLNLSALFLHPKAIGDLEKLRNEIETKNSEEVKETINQIQNESYFSDEGKEFVSKVGDSLNLSSKKSQIRQ